MTTARTASRAIAPRLPVLGALAGLLLSACASVVTPPPPIAPPASPPVQTTPQAPPPPAQPPAAQPATLSVSDLPGWAQEDHVAALKAFQAGCGVSKDAAMTRVCGQARAMSAADAASARAFFETNFQVQSAGDDGLLTAYFAPQYPARMSRNAEFTAPVRGLPDDLVVLDLGPFEPALVGKKITVLN